MDKSIIEKIFSENGLEKVSDVEKIEIGFSNELYSINNRYILKVCGSEKSEAFFEKEVYCFTLFSGRIPVPDLMIVDNTRTLCNRKFMIYHKIQGDNLYSIWHLMSVDERKSIIRQLTDMLKVINREDYSEFQEKFGSPNNNNWLESIIGNIDKSLGKIHDRGILDENHVSRIKQHVDMNKQFLIQQKMGLVYWDAHFDNILVKDCKIVGILDFERTNIGSIDFVLDIVKRMVDFPSKYVCEESEKHIKDHDYADLMEYYELYYPELFSFNNLEQRLGLYSLEHDLRAILMFPDIKEIQDKVMSQAI